MINMLLRRLSRKNPFLTLCYMFFKLLGLAPASLQDSESPFAPPNVWVFSPIGLIYNAGLILLFPVLSYYSIRTLRDSDYPNKSSTTEAFELFKAIFGSIILVTLWLLISLKQRQAVKIANRVMSIDEFLLKDKNISDPETCLLPCVFICCLNAFLWVTLVWTEMVGFDKVQNIIFATEVGPNFIFNWFFTLYTFVIMFLEVRARAINQGMLRLSNNLRSSITRTAADEDKVKNLISLKYAHENLHGIIEDITNLFPFPIFLIITELGASIIYDTYYVVVPFLLPSLEFSWVVAANSLCYVSTQMVPIVTMVVSMDRIAKEMERTPSIVHKVYTNAVLSRIVKSEFKLFSLKLLHQKINFTACDIFSLDCTLISSIFSMTVTYLVIIIQFQIL